MEVERFLAGCNIPRRMIAKIVEAGFISMLLFKHPKLCDPTRLSERVAIISEVGGLPREHKFTLECKMKDLMVRSSVFLACFALSFSRVCIRQCNMMSNGPSISWWPNNFQANMIAGFFEAKGEESFLKVFVELDKSLAVAMVTVTVINRRQCR